MKSLWAPWRIQYLREGGAQSGGCLFCEAPATADHEAALVLDADEHTFVMLNRYPYNNGHLLVVPRRHCGELEALPPDEAAALMARIQQATGVLRRAYGCHGVNVGANLGEAAGAGIPEHLHFHVLPRWHADTNFMGVIAETRVLPEHLLDTWAWLRPLFQG